MVEQKLYYFNPSHDLALASGETNYMPPASARQMETDLALLPLWYAGAEDSVLASSAYNQSFRDALYGSLGNMPRILTPPEVLEQPMDDYIPWGWNPSVCRMFATLGVSTDKLPDSSQLFQLRKWSHRSLAVDLLPKLQNGVWYGGVSYYGRSLNQLKQWVEENPKLVLKAPLSGSGKGLYWCKGCFTSSISGWCTRLIATQGGVIAEPVFDKVMDMAMEFYSDGHGTVCFKGYSWFHTTRNGMYQGNMLVSDEEILKKITVYIPRDVIDSLQLRLIRELSSLLGTTYKGFIGVDMMIGRRDGGASYCIHPCVEINVRMNMGLVARFLFDRFLLESSEGVFKIMYYQQPNEVLSVHRRMEAEFPLRIKGGKVVSGYLPLVPVTSQSHYRAYALIFPMEKSKNKTLAHQHFFLNL